jgi:cyclophilin family peptidyl-prolyl cis-trans isomerase
LKTFLSAALILTLAACTPANHDAGVASDSTMANQTTETTAPEPQAAAPVAQSQEERPMSYYQDKVAELHTSSGDIYIRFYPEAAPNHVKNFIDLAEKGFYNGTKFHRVIPGFMIQGGDPNTISGDPSTWGTGGSNSRLQAEFNNIHHKRGIVSMARSNDPNSASSQFFICVADAGFLDRQYTVFGEVLKGMDIADKIVASPRGAADRPNNPTTIESITIRAVTADEKNATTTAG